MPAERIADDYVLSAERLAPAHVDLGLGDQNGMVDARVAEYGTTAHRAVMDTAAGIDLRRLGFGAPLLASLRNRLTTSA